MALSIIGTAGWAISAPYRGVFPDSGSQLARYASRLNGVEINSSFYRQHRQATYLRWASAVPAGFRFSVKVPRSITQYHRLSNYGDLLRQFLNEVSGLGGKLGFLLAQLPPSLSFEAGTIAAFFDELRQAGAAMACEPRHASWFTPEVDLFLQQLDVARVAADPPRAATGDIPGGDTRRAYFRLHGSPVIYQSDYSKAAIAALAPKLRAEDWCIFDNTAKGHALGNALFLTELSVSAGKCRSAVS